MWVRALCTGSRILRREQTETFRGEGGKRALGGECGRAGRVAAARHDGASLTEGWVLRLRDGGEYPTG